MLNYRELVQTVHEESYTTQKQCTDHNKTCIYNDPLPHNMHCIDTNVPVPVSQFLLDKVVNERSSVFWILSHKHTETEVGIATTTNSKVVSSYEDVNAVRESPLTTYILLEGSLERGGGREREREREREMKELPLLLVYELTAAALLQFTSRSNNVVTTRPL